MSWCCRAGFQRLLSGFVSDSSGELNHQECLEVTELRVLILKYLSRLFAKHMILAPRNAQLLSSIEFLLHRSSIDPLGWRTSGLERCSLRIWRELPWPLWQISGRKTLMSPHNCSQCLIVRSLTAGKLVVLSMPGWTISSDWKTKTYQKGSLFDRQIHCDEPVLPKIVRLGKVMELD